jgi:hypothetical protein
MNNIKTSEKNGQQGKMAFNEHKPHTIQQQGPAENPRTVLYF